MKFHEHHRKDILEILNKHGWNKEHFGFIKRRGRIILNAEKNGFFSFFIKKESDWSDINRGFIDSIQFEVRTNLKSKFYVDSWSDVLRELKFWIDSSAKKRIEF